MRINFARSFGVTVLAACVVGRVDRALIDYYRISLDFLSASTRPLPDGSNAARLNGQGAVSVTDSEAEVADRPLDTFLSPAPPFEDSLQAKYLGSLRDDVIAELGAPFMSSVDASGSRTEYHFCEETAWARFTYVDDRVVEVDDDVFHCCPVEVSLPWAIQQIGDGLTCADVMRLNGRPDFSRDEEWFYSGRSGSHGLRIVFINGIVCSTSDLPPQWCVPPTTLE